MEQLSLFDIQPQTEHSPSLSATLLSWCKIFVLKELTGANLRDMLSHALKDHREFGRTTVHMEEELHYGEGYTYAHDTEEKIARMTCLPESLKDKRYYLPTEEGSEKTWKERLERSQAFRLGTKD